LEIANGPIAFVIDSRAFVVKDHLIRSGALNECIEQHQLQVATVNRELRHVVTGKTAGGLAVDVLTEAIVETVLAGRDGDLCERIFETQSAELTRCMRQDIDADANCLEFGRSLEDTARNAGAVEHKPQRQSADARADNQNFHVGQPLVKNSSVAGSSRRAKS